MPNVIIRPTPGANPAGISYQDNLMPQRSAAPKGFENTSSPFHGGPASKLSHSASIFWLTEPPSLSSHWGWISLGTLRPFPSGRPERAGALVRGSQRAANLQAGAQAQVSRMCWDFVLFLLLLMIIMRYRYLYNYLCSCRSCFVLHCALLSFLSCSLLDMLSLSMCLFLLLAVVPAAAAAATTHYVAATVRAVLVRRAVIPEMVWRS